jgi:hypothetical protein
VKYYIYISDAKVDMLFLQVPHDIKKKVATEWKMDLKLLSASRRVETEGEDNRIARLETVVEFIRETGNLGTLDEPDEYIEDTAQVRWGTYGAAQSPIVYFCGKTERTQFALGGSVHHVIGNCRNEVFSSASATPALYEFLGNYLGVNDDRFEFNRQQRKFGEYEPLQAVEIAAERLYGPMQGIEFMAKRLLFWQGGAWPDEIPFPAARKEQEMTKLLATPLYVAMTS